MCPSAEDIYEIIIYEMHRNISANSLHWDQTPMTLTLLLAKSPLLSSLVTIIRYDLTSWEIRQIIFIYLIVS